mgnify:FL=1
MTLVALGSMGLLAQRALSTDPFEFFRPHVSVSAAERARLEAGQAIVKTLQAESREVAVFSAARIAIDGDRLVAWVRRIQDLKRGKFVPAIGRFSEPPRLDDVSALELDKADLDDLEKCRPGACGLKLSEAEIGTLVPLAKRRTPDGQAAVQRAFREALVARAAQYRTSGLATASRYTDHSTPVVLDREFTALMSHSGFIDERLPGLARSLVRSPPGPSHDLESFLYWSKELLGGRPIVSITHVTIVRPGDVALPTAVVAAKQVYATPYMTGSLAVTTIVGGRDGTPHYLAYLNRSRVDVLDGLFGGLVRRVMERRVREDAAMVVDAVRQRLQSGEPPAS